MERGPRRNPETETPKDIYEVGTESAQSGRIRGFPDSQGGEGNVSGRAAELRSRATARDDGNQAGEAVSGRDVGGRTCSLGSPTRCGLCKALLDVLIVLKFDRASRSIKHFCELYETYFKDGTEGTGCDSGIDPARTRRWGRAWWESSWCLRRWNGRRPGTDKEAINHIRESGVSLWEGAVWEADDSCAGPSSDEDLVDDEGARTLRGSNSGQTEGVGIGEMADRLNAKAGTTAGESVDQESALQPSTEAEFHFSGRTMRDRTPIRKCVRGSGAARQGHTATDSVDFQ